MDKKEKSINSHIGKAIGYSDKAHDELHDALIELGKSDWVSVEDELPPYNENIISKSYRSFYQDYTFVDGTPFGTKE